MKKTRTNNDSVLPGGGLTPVVHPVVPAPQALPLEDPLSLAKRMVSLTEAVNACTDVETAATRVAELMTSQPALCEHVHITARTAKNAPPVMTHSDDVARRLGDCAGFLGDASALHTVLPGADEASTTQHSDGHWKRFLERAAEHGVRSIHATRMVTSKRRIGVITFYSVHADTFERVGEGTLATITDTVALALEHKIELANLTRALSTRSLIGTALGILMERHDISETDAWQMLSSTSQQLNIRLVDICTRIVGDSRFSSEGTVKTLRLDAPEGGPT
ncbi:ANTAR domain-containing protein [Nocardiopsis ansamitocini]|uniref:ANTAR domain-containing protein n=1 Tax=Nocardiopsis ansamitocini TaxID=1670832 RepID=A0A9W6P4V0_9ACTN|nr:ANTAR domain-containing protein [Nocardiopsis ansamitocini]GLU47186.1 hypothetical protein Nans01_15370 [Nocardiopsis ansamitocini]